MSERIDFSANASVYDRRHGAAVADEAVDRLWSAAALNAGDRVLDVGAGTGRVAIPLASRGCHVVAVEPAAGMLEQLRAKDANHSVLTVVAEGSHLPFPVECFDVVVIARLLYLTPDWQGILREASRVLALDGRLLHEWGNGEADEEWAQIREQARQLFQQAGVRSPFHPGVRSEAEIDQHLVDLRLTCEASINIGPGPEITIREFLRRLVAGELSYTWAIPRDVRDTCLPVLERWSATMFDLDRPVPMPRSLRWTVYRKSAA